MGSKNALYEPLPPKVTICREAPEPDEEGDGGGGEIVGNCISILPGIYEVRYVCYTTGYFKNNAKVTVHCSVVNPEEYAGTPLERFYNVDFLKGPPKRYGKYRAKARGDLVREIGMLIGPTKRLDRLSISGLRHKRLICEVETVTNDRDKRPLSPDQQYSCIRRFIKILDEDW